MVVGWLHQLQPQSASYIQIQQDREWLVSFPVVVEVSWYFIDSILMTVGRSEVQAHSWSRRKSQILPLLEGDSGVILSKIYMEK